MTEDREQKTDFPSSVLNPPPSGLRHLFFWPIFAGGVALDLWTKHAVFNLLKDLGRTGLTIIDGFLRLQWAENPGAAFGLAAGQRWLLVAVSVVALAVVIAVFLFAGINRKIVQLALALFSAGVSGNLYDRLFNNGLVRDFIDVVYWPGKHWPAFNVADSLLCVAVALLIISGFPTRQSSQIHPQPQK